MTQRSNPIHLSRWPYLVSALLVLALGWNIRAHAPSLPTFIGAYAPDALWALLVFLLVAALKPRRAPWHTALIALAFAYAIEFSQLYHAPWINIIRGTRLGGLVLGHGFLWSDLFCYAVGIGVGALLNRGLLQEQKRQRNQGFTGASDS